MLKVLQEEVAAQHRVMCTWPVYRITPPRGHLLQAVLQSNGLNTSSASVPRSCAVQLHGTAGGAGVDGGGLLRPQLVRQHEGVQHAEQHQHEQHDERVAHGVAAGEPLHVGEDVAAGLHAALLLGRHAVAPHAVHLVHVTQGLGRGSNRGR